MACNISMSAVLLLTLVCMRTYHNCIGSINVHLPHGLVYIMYAVHNGVVEVTFMHFDGHVLLSLLRYWLRRITLNSCRIVFVTCESSFSLR